MKKNEDILRFLSFWPAVSVQVTFTHIFGRVCGSTVHLFCGSSVLRF